MMHRHLCQGSHSGRLSVTDPLLIRQAAAVAGHGAGCRASLPDLGSRLGIQTWVHGRRRNAAFRPLAWPHGGLAGCIAFAALLAMCGASPALADDQASKQAGQVCGGDEIARGTALKILRRTHFRARWRTRGPLGRDRGCSAGQGPGS